MVAVGFELHGFTGGDGQAIFQRAHAHGAVGHGALVNGDVLRPGRGSAGQGDVAVAVVGDHHVANAHGYTGRRRAAPGVIDGYGV